MIINENNKQYIIHICDNLKNINFMIKWITDFLNNKERRLIGIDFEFNRVNNERKIALCQLNMETMSRGNLSNYIFIFYPPDIKNNIFVKLLTDTTIIKILHGGESLDVPYLFSEVLVNERDRYNFCINLFDTRYMCEYYNISNNLITNRCRIYDLLLQMNIITNKKYNELEMNDKLMGNIWEINLAVNKLSHRAIIYCLYDVLYLPSLFDSFPKTDVYLKILPEISNYNSINRHTGDFIKIHNMISKYNTHYYNNISYTDIYISVYIWLECYDEFKFLFHINYFKKFYEIIIKNIIYSKISNEYKKNVYPIVANDINNPILIQFQTKLLKYINMMF